MTDHKLRGPGTHFHLEIMNNQETKIVRAGEKGANNGRISCSRGRHGPLQGAR